MQNLKNIFSVRCWQYFHISILIQPANQSTVPAAHHKLCHSNELKPFLTLTFLMGNRSNRTDSVYK